MRILTALLFIGAAAFAQPDCPVSGTVVNSVTHAPVLRARISVAGPQKTETTQSDAAGKWRVIHRSCESVTITAARSGYIQLRQTVETPGHDVKLELVPQAVIAGRVVDNEGDPLSGILVRLMRFRIVDGARTAQTDNGAITNDLGDYRVFGLTAGRYAVCTSPADGMSSPFGSRSFAEKCYPGPIGEGVPSMMEVAAGSEGRVDFTLTPLTGVRVSGAVSGRPEGTTVTVSLPPSPRTAIGSTRAPSAPLRSDGTFSIQDISPGSYTLEASSNRTPGRVSAQRALNVGSSDIDGIQLQLEHGVTVTGTIRTLAVAANKPDTTRFTVQLKHENGGIVTAAPNAWDATRTTFTMNEVAAGSYRISLLVPAPFYFKGATYGGQDIANTYQPLGPGQANIEIVVSDDGGAIDVEVTDSDVPVAAWVLIENDRNPVRNGRTNGDGRFKMEFLPPGDYKVYAWDDNANVEYRNPEWMQRYGKPMAVTILSGQTAQVKLVRQIAPE